MLYKSFYNRKFFFFFNAPTTTEVYTLSLHDARSDLGGSVRRGRAGMRKKATRRARRVRLLDIAHARSRSEEHTSELQSRGHLVCRLLLEKKNTPQPFHLSPTESLR